MAYKKKQVYDVTTEITDGDGIVKIDVDNKYAKFVSYYLSRTGMMVDPKELKAVNKDLASFLWFISAIAKIYDDYLQLHSSGE